MVSVPRRKQEGVNEDGGVGEVRTVEAKTVAGTRVVFYSVKYVLDRRVEKDMYLKASSRVTLLPTETTPTDH